MSTPVAYAAGLLSGALLAGLAVYADARLDPIPSVAPPGRIERELILTVECDRHGPAFWRVEGPRVQRYTVRKP